MSFNYGAGTVTINPLTCSAATNGTTTITGLGSDNVSYTVRLTGGQCLICGAALRGFFEGSVAAVRVRRSA